MSSWRIYQFWFSSIVRFKGTLSIISFCFVEACLLADADANRLPTVEANWRVTSGGCCDCRFSMTKKFLKGCDHRIEPWKNYRLMEWKYRQHIALTLLASISTSVEALSINFRSSVADVEIFSGENTELHFRFLFLISLTLSSWLDTSLSLY